MSFFAVEEREIAVINPHGNADKLELGKLVGMEFQFCVKKDEYKAGAKVVYFPIDSILPDDLSMHIGVKAFLSGRNHDRIKTVRLRGQISQGVVVPQRVIEAYLTARGKAYSAATLTDDLGVTKYEPPTVLQKGANLKPLRGALYSYDIEGADRFPHILEMIMDRPVYITEKLEGTNFGISISTEDEKLVNQRNFIVEPIEGEGPHFFHEVVDREKLFDIVEQIRAKYYPKSWVTLRGELIGENVQSNYYGLKGRTVRFFELEVDGKPIDSGDFLGMAREYMFATVPVLAKNVVLRDWLAGRTVQEASDGQSELIPGKLREGIVIKPATEDRIDEIGRLFLKQRSPKYLADTEN